MPKVETVVNETLNDESVVSDTTAQASQAAAAPAPQGMHPTLRKTLKGVTVVAGIAAIFGGGYYAGKNKGVSQTMAQLDINPKSIGAK